MGLKHEPKIDVPQPCWPMCRREEEGDDGIKAMSGSPVGRALIHFLTEASHTCSRAAEERAQPKT